jgi:hypothetical protein
MQDAMRELSAGVSSNYEHEGQPVPEYIAKRIVKCADDIKAAVEGAKGDQDKCVALSIRLWNLGHEVGRAAWYDGYEEGKEAEAPGAVKSG